MLSAQDPLLVVKIAAPTLAAIGSGYLASLSYYTVPVIRSTAMINTSLGLQQWKDFWNAGIKTTPSVTYSSMALFGYLAYFEVDPTKRQLYTLTATALFAIGPFTFLYMRPYLHYPLLKEREALERGEKPGLSVGEIAGYLRSFEKINFGRALVLLASSVLGLYTIAL